MNTTLEGVLRLRDEWSGQIAQMRKSTNEFINENKASFKAIGEAVAGAAAIVGALSAAIVALGVRGAAVADVRDQFDLLQKSAGNTGDVIGGLRAAFQGTISDYNIMKTVNQGFSQGLRLTQQDLELTAKSARVLADRTGGDTRQAFEVLTGAMATGRDMSLKTIGLNIDAAAATENYARSIGKQKAELNEAQITEAKQVAILSEMKRVLGESGEAQVDFADRVDQAKVALENLMDGVGMGIAQSPVLAAAFDSVKESLASAFGTDQQQTIAMIVGWVEEFAIWLAKAGQIGVEVARFLSNAWTGVQFLFNTIMAGLTDALGIAQSAVASVIETAASVPGAPEWLTSYAKHARSASDELQMMSNSFKTQADEALDNAARNNAALDQVSAGLGNMITNMEKAKGTQVETKATTDALTGGLRNQAEGTKELSKELQNLVKQYKALTDEGMRKEASDNLKAAIIALGPLAEASGKEVDRVIEKLKDLGDEGRAAAKELQAAVDKAQGVALLGMGPDKRLGGLNGVIPEGMARDLGMSQLAGAAAAEFGNAFQDAAARRKWFFDNIPVNMPAEQYRAVAKAVGVELGDTIGKEAGKEAGKETLTGFKKAMADLPNVILGAIQGGGNVFGAVGSHLGGALFGPDSGFNKSITGFLTDNLGQTIGGALGTMLPGLGSILGAGIGSLMDGLFGGEERQVNDMRDAFLETFDGWENLHRQLAEAGQEGLMQRIFDADTVQEYEAAVKAAEGALADFQAQQALDKEAQDALTAAMEKYGIEAGQLGPQFAKARLDADMAAWMQDWRLLTAAGADHGALLEAMGPDLSELVQQYKEAGVAIPEAMRPVLEEAIENRQLLDENGEAIESLADSGLTFAQSMDDMFTHLMEKVDDLINALLGINDVDVSPRVTIPGGDDFAPVHHGGGDFREFQHGSGGFKDFGAGTPALLHGTEGVFTPGNLVEIARMMAGELAPLFQGGGGMIAGRLSIDLTTGIGELVAEAVERDIGGARTAVRRAFLGQGAT